jgi:hypothetical protein
LDSALNSFAPSAEEEEEDDAEDEETRPPLPRLTQEQADARAPCPSSWQ